MLKTPGAGSNMRLQQTAKKLLDDPMTLNFWLIGGVHDGSDRK